MLLCRPEPRKGITCFKKITIVEQPNITEVFTELKDFADIHPLDLSAWLADTAGDDDED